MNIRKVELAYASAMVVALLLLLYSGISGERTIGFLAVGTCVVALFVGSLYVFLTRRTPASSRWNDEVSEKAGDRIVDASLVGWLLVLALCYFVAFLASQDDQLARVAVYSSLLGGAAGSHALRRRRSMGKIRAISIAFSVALLAVIPVLAASGVL